jgi:hypothetical protein
LLFQQKLEGSQLPLASLANADRDYLSEFLVFEQTLGLSINNQSTDRFDGERTPFLGAEYFIFVAHGDASLAGLASDSTTSDSTAGLILFNIVSDMAKG